SKGNAGHTLAASGLVSLVCLVQALRHGEIPASLYAEEPSDYIDWSQSAFQIPQALTPWPRTGEKPRLGAVSAFGMSGTNAHAIVEEYVAAPAVATPPAPAVLLVLSAKTPAALRQRIDELAEALRQDDGSTALSAVSYTLLCTRQHFSQRAAIVASDRDHALALLALLAAGERQPNLFRGSVAREFAPQTGLARYAQDRIAAAAGLQHDPAALQECLATLADLYCQGYAIADAALFGPVPPPRAALPTYPFERERLWIETTARRRTGAASHLHPLLHSNTSDLHEQRYSSTFAGDEFFLADHRIGGRRLLPGTAYLEMARAAVQRAARPGPQQFISLREVVWLRPFAVDGEPAELHIRLGVQDDGRIAFQIVSGNADEGGLLHCQGIAVVQDRGEVSPLDAAALAAAASAATLDAADCYALYQSLGMDYGPSHRGIAALELGQEQVIARLQLDFAAHGGEGFGLHPGQLDSALQAAIGLALDSEERTPALPFALDAIEIHQALPAQLQAWVRYSPGSTAQGRVRRLDIDLYDDTGTVFAALRGFATRSLADTAAEAGGPGPDASAADSLPQPVANAAVPAGADPAADAANYLRQLLSGAIKLAPHRIDVTAPLEVYGIDSVMATELTAQLEQVFGPLSKTLFFEYQTIAELSGYFLRSHSARLQQLLGQGSAAPDTARSRAAAAAAVPATNTPTLPLRRTLATARGGDGAMDIAIIGLAGRYPQAPTLEDFWNNLRAGRDSVTEIPAERWDHRPFTEAVGATGKGYCRWGGFLDGVEDFDPQFFGISPREAVVLDPQERLFLQCAYATLEDAGYTRAMLRERVAGNVGVYVGVMYEEYPYLGVQAQLAGTPVALAGSPASCANRVSYYCDFHGPSMTVDSMCSSSLTTIHLACESLLRGECALALAGGVNVSVHPNKYLVLLQGQFSSSVGRCESFGRGGDGYVPGEGVGAVLLKPLAQAEADGDHIYGVIKATAVNHGGKTNGYTVPNPLAQSAVIAQALRRGGIEPGWVSYVEAHGTGTALGDPIEIAGLSKAFGAEALPPQSCAIGSVKSNIGHCESAAGIAGVTKVLLQLRHGQIAPSLHSAELNPKIDFANSPFVVPQRLETWQRPSRDIAGQRRELPRIAGISSFGAGGSNAHVIIQEYRAAAAEPAAGAQLLVLSARTPEQLQARARLLLAALQNAAAAESLADIAYTLQTGREAMGERLALVAADHSAAVMRLQAFLDGRAEEFDDVFAGNAGERRNLAAFADDEAFREALQKWIARGRYSQLAQAWSTGLELDWNLLHRGRSARRVSLPTYPFARVRCWLDLDGAPAPAPVSLAAPRTAVAAGAAAAPRAGLALNEVAGSGGLQFSLRLDGSEFFLRDHRVGGRPVLPGVAYLEIARAAAVQAWNLGAAEALTLQRVVWLRPLAVEASRDVAIRFKPDGDARLNFEIASRETGGETVVHCQGSVLRAAAAAPAPLDLARLQVDCPAQPLDAAALYAIYASAGLEYGPAHRGVRSLHAGSGQVLAGLELPAAAAGDFLLNPALLDAALQAALGMSLQQDGLESARPALPFAIDSVNAVAPCAGQAWAWIRQAAGRSGEEAVRKLDIDLCDAQGRVCVQLRGFAARAVAATGTGASAATALLQPAWLPLNLPQPAGVLSGQRGVLLCGVSEAVAAAVRAAVGGAQFVAVSPSGDSAAQYHAAAAAGLHMLQELLASRPATPVPVQWVVADGSPLQGLAGMLKTARQESPQLQGQLIALETLDDAGAIVRALQQAAASPEQIELRWAEGQSWSRGWQDLIPPAQQTAIWKQRGNYLITGGAGGLGLIFAGEIARRADAPRLFLTGRSALKPAQEAALAALRESGAEVSYHRVDVADAAAVQRLVDEIRAGHGELQGIVHSAGVLRDGFLLRKSADDLRQVLLPKVDGCAALDAASAGHALDFFVCFSSMSSALGNVGQADYAAANGYMDAFAAQRNRQVRRGLRSGRTVSLNWPLWAEGGMGVSDATQARAKDSSGLVPLASADGLRVFYETLASSADQVLVLSGAVQPLRQFLTGRPPLAGAAARPAARASGLSRLAEDGSPISAKQLRAQLVRSVAETLMLDPSEVDEDRPLEALGLDSILSVNWVRDINEGYGVAISVTDIYDHPSIRAMAAHLRKLIAALPPPAPAAPAAQENLDVDAILERLQNGQMDVAEAERLLATLNIAQEKGFG
ncbi:SDR family NAD(P)-dependent oxidoreductase, partial [Tahibacter harae]